MIELSVLKLKNNDHISEGIELIPLISDIDDIEGILMEHKELNRNSKKLEFALIEHEGEYYFIDCKKSIREDVYITDGKSYICPSCRQKLILISGFVRNGTKVNSYLRHPSSDEECDFKTYYEDKNSEKINPTRYTGEGKLHKELKLSTLRNIIDEGIRLNIPSSYTIDMYNDKPIVNFEYREVFLTNAMSEKVALKKDSVTKGTRPDITAYTDTGEVIYIEVTNISGKRVTDYYDIWNRLNSTVIEVRKTGNLDKTIDYTDFYDEEGCFNDEMYYEALVLNDKEFRILYSPIMEKARREKLKILTAIANKKRIAIQKNQLKEFINKKLNEINQDAKDNKIPKMPVKDIVYDKNGIRYIGFNNFEYPSYWYKIIYKGIVIYRKLPSKISHELKNRYKFLKIIKNEKY